MNYPNIGVIGVGHMAGAIVEGLVKAGWDSSKMSLTTRTPANAQRLAEKVGAKATSNIEAAFGADLVIVAVKPVDVVSVLAEIRPALERNLADGVETTLVSVAVGLPTDLLEAQVPSGIGVVRVLPNTPCALGLGMAVICPGKNCGETQLGLAVELFDAIGKTLVTDEKYLNIAGALSGSGTGYLFYVAEAMVEAAVTLGLGRKDAQLLTSQGLLGAASLLAEGGHPGQLREAVTSPGGTTAAAFREFEKAGMRAAFLAGIEACTERSAALAEIAAKSCAGNE